MAQKSRPFRLDALQVRMALSELMKRYPLDEQRTPMGLEMLFQVIGGLSLDEVVPYGEMLEKRELNLLSSHFDRTQETRVLMGIAQILAVRKDHRAIGPIRRWLHYLPGNPELNYLRQVWNARGFRELFAGELTWLHQLMANPEMALIPFFLAEIKAGRLTLKDLSMGLPDEVTPLLKALELKIFASGGLGLAQINAARAYQLAEQFLKNGQDEAVRSYFMNCPESRWPLSLVRLVFEKKGAPDGRRQPFYADLPKGVTWGFRRQLFGALIAEGDLDHRRSTFWKRYLHHAQSLYWQGQVLVIAIHPMRIIEKKAHTEVIVGDSNKPQITALGPMWEQEMKAMLNDYIQWGHAR